MGQEKQEKRSRRVFTADFKTDAVRLCRTGDRSIAQVSVALGIHESNLRTWIHQADVDVGGCIEGHLTTDERQELTRLRRENKRLTMEREIEKATAFFVRENA